MCSLLLQILDLALQVHCILPPPECVLAGSLLSVCGALQNGSEVCSKEGEGRAQFRSER